MTHPIIPNDFAVEIHATSATAHPDALWFKAHPKRAHHGRLPLPGELATAPRAGTYDYCIVRQIEPGTRARLYFYLGEHDAPPPDDEYTLEALYDVIVQRAGDGMWGPIPRDAVMDRFILNGLLDAPPKGTA